MIEPLELDLDCCLKRQDWLTRWLGEQDAPEAVLMQPGHVYYLTGFRCHPLLSAMVHLTAQGVCTLVAPNQRPERVAADQVLTYPAQWLSTLRQEQVEAIGQTFSRNTKTGSSATRMAVEFSTFPPHLSQSLGLDPAQSLIDLEPALWKRRRRKDPDEMALLGRAIDCTEAMYARAREIITPGITEIAVFNELHRVAVEVAGEPLTALGNDYQSNSPGGAPRQRPTRAGEMMILDLGPAYRGYHADNCRTFRVGEEPSDAQLGAWQVIVDTLRWVERTVKPGVGCRDLFENAVAMLDQSPDGEFNHHLGHGVGLFPHEAPHLNPNWDDVFEVGDVFTAEPGLYSQSLRAGIRIEENFLVTENGVERLTSAPVEL